MKINRWHEEKIKSHPDLKCSTVRPRVTFTKSKYETETILYYVFKRCSCSPWAGTTLGKIRQAKRQGAQNLVWEYFLLRTNFRNQSFKYIFVIILYWDYESMVYITTKLTILIPKNLSFFILYPLIWEFVSKSFLDISE